MTKPLILIPARMASRRLPGKPLLNVGGAPMIVQVLRRAQAADLGDVAIACDGEEIKQAVEATGGVAILTDADLPSGSDRIWQAAQKMQSDHDIIINVQGDMPTLDPAIIKSVLAVLEDSTVDIATLAAVITDEHEITDPAVVKVAFSEQTGQALYFSRATIPHGEGELYHHIGIYAYRRHALERFVSLPPSPLERREKLEQLRALEAGMKIGVAVIDTVPLGVDTEDTLQKARSMYGG